MEICAERKKQDLTVGTQKKGFERCPSASKSAAYLRNAFCLSFPGKSRYIVWPKRLYRVFHIL
jgi:hypothetical protein